ncbi:MAG: PqqD family protein [Woeseiaceae bacterium]
MSGLPAKTIEATHPEPVQWRPVEGLLVEEIGDEVLVLDSKAGRIHQFNYTAGIVWTGLMKGESTDEITLALVERFDVPEARAAKDAEKMIQNLKILKLIESV